MNRITQYELTPDFARAMVAAGFGKPLDVPQRGDNFEAVPDFAFPQTMRYEAPLRYETQPEEHQHVKCDAVVAIAVSAAAGAALWGVLLGLVVLAIVKL